MRVLQAQGAFKALKVIQDLGVRKVITADRRVLKDHRALKVLEDLKAHRALKALKEIRDPGVRKATLVDHRVKSGRKGLVVNGVLKGLQGSLIRQNYRAALALLGVGYRLKMTKSFPIEGERMILDMKWQFMSKLKVAEKYMLIFKLRVVMKMNGLTLG